MADTKLSALAAATTVDDDDVLYVVNSDGSRRITAANLLTSVAGQFALAATASIGATSLTLDRSPTGPWLTLGEASWVVVGPGSVTCEVRKVSSLSGTTLVVVGGLWGSHASGSVVWLWAGDELPTALWGAVGDGSTDDTAALQAAIDQSGRLGDGDSMGFVVTGLGRNHLISKPIVHTDGARVQRLRVTCSGFSDTVDADGAAWMSSNHNVIEFTADASTDTFTIARGTTTSGTVDSKVVFKDPLGAGLPTPIVEGLVYWIKTWTGGAVNDTFTVSATKGGTTLDLTSDGDGRAYQKIDSTGRPFLFDVYLDGAAVAGTLNGFRICPQQPLEIRKIRADNFGGTGLIIGDRSDLGAAQQGEFYNVELIANETAAKIYGLGGNFYYLDIEQCTLGLDLQGQGWHFYGAHFESNTADVTIGGVASAVRANLFSGGYFGATGADTDHVPITVDGNSGFQLVNCYFGGLVSSSGSIVINDTQNSRQLKYEELTDSHSVIGYLFQPSTSSPWVYLDGSATWLKKVRTVLTFSEIAAGATGSQTATVTGAAVGDRVAAAGESGSFSSLLWTAYVSAADTVTVTILNPTASAVTPPAVNWNINVLH